MNILVCQAIPVLPEENLFQDFSAKHTEAMGVSRD
jgi:hypothetical protein